MFKTKQLLKNSKVLYKLNSQKVEKRKETANLSIKLNLPQCNLKPGLHYVRK